MLARRRIVCPQSGASEPFEDESIPAMKEDSEMMVTMSPDAVSSAVQVVSEEEPLSRRGSLCSVESAAVTATAEIAMTPVARISAASPFVAMSAPSLAPAVETEGTVSSPRRHPETTFARAPTVSLTPVPESRSQDHSGGSAAVQGSAEERAPRHRTIKKTSLEKRFLESVETAPEQLQQLPEQSGGNGGKKTAKRPAAVPPRPTAVPPRPTAEKPAPPAPDMQRMENALLLSKDSELQGGMVQVTPESLLENPWTSVPKRIERGLTVELPAPQTYHRRSLFD